LGGYFLAGRAWKFEDDVDTDAIIPGRYLVINDPEDLAKHVFEGVRPEFARQVVVGDFVVAGRNFGCGSSREHAPLGLKGSGVRAVVAESFARIFFRNAINIGLPLFVSAEADSIRDGDEIEIDAVEGIIYNRSTGETYRTTPLPPFLQEIVATGGLVEYTKRMVRSA
jgi:3-isopropylmalate/(R)-2-methylmalate dehydratase small subunit